MSSEIQRQGAGLFDGGPPFMLEGWLHLRRQGKLSAFREAALICCAAWLPLAVLATLQGNLITAGRAGSFLLDIAVHARYLVALPVLVLAHSACIPRLSSIAQNFLESYLVADRDRLRFESDVNSTKRLRDSPLVEIVVILLAYAFVLILTLEVPRHLLPGWYLSESDTPGGLRLSAAGWWHTLVSLPLLLVLILGWIWRVMLWGRFLWCMSRLDLRLLPSHPDRAAGLRFAGHSLRAFAVPAFGLSAIVAGGIANRVLHEGAALVAYINLMAGIVLLVLLLFASPLLVFSGKLLTCWQRGVIEYGTLANRVGQEFERNWLNRSKPFAEEPLEAPAFSAVTDLYQIVANVYAMRLVPIDAMSMLLLIGATLLPLLPVWLLSAPLDEMLRNLAGFLV